MSSNEQVKITEIIGNGIYQFNTNQRMIWATSPIQYQCYDWLKEAYPDIYKEFVAVTKPIYWKK